MNGLSFWQLLGLMLAGFVGGAALLAVLLGLVAQLAQDDLASECLAMGATLMLWAAFIAARVLA